MKLAKRLKNDDEPQYAGLCHLAVARCEQSLGNIAGESEALIEAARCFLKSEMTVRNVGCPSFEEQLTAGKVLNRLGSPNISMIKCY